MQIISKKRIKDFVEVHPEAEGALRDWHSKAKKASWQNFVQLKQTFPQADIVGDLIVFNVGSNRLIAYVNFQFFKVYIKHILSHMEYDREEWKQ